MVVEFRDVAVDLCAARVDFRVAMVECRVATFDFRRPTVEDDTEVDEATLTAAASVSEEVVAAGPGVVLSEGEAGVTAALANCSSAGEDTAEVARTALVDNDPGAGFADAKEMVGAAAVDEGLHVAESATVVSTRGTMGPVAVAVDSDSGAAVSTEAVEATIMALADDGP